MSTARRRLLPLDSRALRLETMDRLVLRGRAADPPGRPRGTVLLLTGRSEFIEKYAETMADLVDRGFAVRTFDWRGQGLSSRLLAERRTGHVGRFEDYLDDLDLMITTCGAEAPAPLLVMAHSMGAHIALRFCADRPAAAARITRLVALSPMLRIVTRPVPYGFARLIAWTACRLGLATTALPLRDPVEAADNPLTSDPSRAEDQAFFERIAPELALGPPSWGWLDAAFRSCARVLARGRLEAIRIPILLAVAGTDRIVDPATTLQAAVRLPAADFVAIDEARHEILKERDPIRARFWAAFDDFVAEIRAEVA